MCGQPDRPFPPVFQASTMKGQPEKVLFYCGGQAESKSPWLSAETILLRPVQVCELDFTARKRSVEASQLLKGRPKKVKGVDMSLVQAQDMH
jgi:hypothetical protein